MGAITKIEWCHHTFNPWWGCTQVSPLCDRCYAMMRSEMKVIPRAEVSGQRHPCRAVLRRARPVVRSKLAVKLQVKGRSRCRERLHPARPGVWQSICRR
jgi:protein gp37